MRLEARFRWLPTPFRSVLLFIVWLLLNNSVSPGHLFLAAFFAITIPWVTFPFRDPQPLIVSAVRYCDCQLTSCPVDTWANEKVTPRFYQSTIGFKP